ncbi:hypothetical protein DICPUDRAFT_150574 [Dictyostelium purpureum]|uniref:DUF202 domain-containing protein n=1 Tax=Dictyostelium purpureum TaxID=5786 RepID=F0ZGP1_DICPU|nr:uncharacterized protein DICPUDRAFT_150574 [Dictyostelium purpureum]EGC36880.1 hypothetical protein DICPUDRAFT_150574 [Dictyostelium purpureum]|eukprot:XP_003286602.1 hypothetical protein DICPUDRAFT_150574 [Dictyostelium purpureum]
MKKIKNPVLSKYTHRIRNKFKRTRNNTNRNNNNNINDNNNNNNNNENISSNISDKSSGDSSSDSSILHRTVHNAHHNANDYSDEEQSDDSENSENSENKGNIELKKLKKLKKNKNLQDIDLSLLLQDEIYDQVEEDVLNTLLEYTTEEDLKKFKKYLRKKELRSSKSTEKDHNESDEYSIESDKSIESEESEESEESDKEEDKDLLELSPFYYEDDYGFHEYSDDFKLNIEDIESNRQVLNESLANSVLRRKPSRLSKSTSISSTKSLPITKSVRSPISLSPRIESLPTTPILSPKKKPSTVPTPTATAPTTPNLRESIKRKAKLYLIPPKLLMQMDDVEMIKEDICATDRSLAGYIRTGLSITGLGVAVLSRIGVTTKTLIVSIIFFAYGISLTIIGIRRNKVLSNYLKKGYMKPSIISVILVTLLTFVIIGSSYYVIA